MNSHFRWLGAAVFLSLWPVSAFAQDAAPPAALLARRLSEEVRARVLKGRAQLDNNDDLAVATLRDAAQSALPSLEQVAGKNALVAAPESLPRDFVTANLTHNAAEAHYYWGVAADRFARRDESITALARAVRLSRASAGASLDRGILRRDAADVLKRVLKDGLPLIAPDDVVDSIALFAHGGLWTPRRSAFDPSPLAAEIGGAALAKEEFLITDGSLFPPLAPTSNPLVRVPSYYQEVPFENLPDALKLNKMIAGYTRQNSGANKGQWRQIVRVFYASPHLTKERRDDLPRARALCEQFLRVHALFKEQLGASNQFVRGDKTEGVTTLWLLEVSALWPQDDEDPSVLAQLGPRMPGLNTGTKREPSDPETTALMRPWMPVAGQSESEPGEILFWKAGLARPEAEWVRELCHEYGHVALPPLGGFRPPLEPFGNGVMGETLGMLWAAQVPSRFGAAPSGKGASDAMIGDFSTHVTTQALPAWQFFRKAGPESALRASNTREGWTYLQGLTVYLERVYGGRMLGRALAPLSQRAANVTSIAARRSLMDTQTLLNSVDVTWRDPWNGRKTLPVWLPGALNLPLNAPRLIARSEAGLKAKTRAEVLLWVPSGADSLRIEGAGAQNLRAIGLPFQAAQGGMRVYFAGKSGWQSFSLLAGADAKISAARFERK